MTFPLTHGLLFAALAVVFAVTVLLNTVSDDDDDDPSGWGV